PRFAELLARQLSGREGRDEGPLSQACLARRSDLGAAVAPRQVEVMAHVPGAAQHEGSPSHRRPWAAVDQRRREASAMRDGVPRSAALLKRDPFQPWTPALRRKASPAPRPGNAPA